MRGKKAKMIRDIAREMAFASGTQKETNYDQEKGKRRGRVVGIGTIRVSHCERALIKTVKKLAGQAKNMNGHRFYDIALASIY